VARDLTRNAWFEVTGPDGTRGGPVHVIVIPLVTLSGRAGAPGLVLTAEVTAGSAGDELILQRLTDGQWVSVRVRSLGLDGRAVFALPASAKSAWRVLLAATAAHGAALSNPAGS
jgi:hypothetical protein